MARDNAYLGLARKWRPRTFDDLVGQEAVAQSLAGALSRRRIAQGHILTGPRGIGKTTSARILARALNCEQGPTATPCGRCRHCVDIAESNHLDVIEIDAATHTGVEAIRDLLETVVQRPAAARYKVYIIDEVHMLSTGAFNALLKTLEEPPPFVVFVLATTEFDKVPETVRSRCVVHAFRRLSAEDIARRLAHVAHGEGVDLDEAAAREIFGVIGRSVEGGMRDALVVLDQLLAATDMQPTLEAVNRLLGLAERGLLTQTVDWLANGRTAELLGLVEDLVSRGRSLERFIKALIAYLRDLMLLQSDVDRALVELTGEPLEAAEKQARELAPATLYNMLNQMFELEERLKRSGQARFLLEFTFLRLAAIKPVVPLDEIIKRVGALPEQTLGSAPAPPPAPERPQPKAPPARSTTPPAQTLGAPQFAPPRTPRTSVLADSQPVEGGDATPAPQAAPADGAGDLDETLERVIHELPANARFLGRYLKGAQGWRWDDQVFELRLGDQDTYQRRALLREDNRAVLEQALTVVRGGAATLRVIGPPDTADQSRDEPAPTRDQATGAVDGAVEMEAGAAEPAPPAPADDRTAAERARAFMQHEQAGERLKLLRDMLSAHLIDPEGRELDLGPA